MEDGRVRIKELPRPEITNLFFRNSAFLCTAVSGQHKLSIKKSPSEKSKGLVDPPGLEPGTT